MPIENIPRAGYLTRRDTKTGLEAVFAVGPAFQEQRTEANSLTEVTFSEPVTHIAIYNADPNNVGVFIVNGRTIRLRPELGTPVFRVGGIPSATVQISGTVAFDISRFD